MGQSIFFFCLIKRRHFHTKVLRELKIHTKFLRELKINAVACAQLAFKM